MSLAFFSDLSRNLLVRTLIATAAVFLLLGFATGALPVKCLTEGLTACGAVQLVGPKADAAVPLRFAVPPAPKAVTVAAVESTLPTLTRNEVVSDSFALLNLGAQAAPPLATSWKSTAASDENALATRTVKTVAIHADGTPADAPEVPVTQVAEASPVVLPAVTPLVAPASEDAAAAIDAVAPSAEAKPAVVEKLALVDDPPAPKPKKVSTGGKSGIVSGQGANVHESSKSSSKVLFALAGGTKVTVLDTNRGWVHITDAKGRSGWMYKDYLS